MERRASIELDAGAKLIGCDEVAATRAAVLGMLKTVKVYRRETDYGYVSFWFSTYHGDITISVDRTADGLYRLKKVLGDPPRLMKTTNFTDEWPELIRLYELLETHCGK